MCKTAIEHPRVPFSNASLNVFVGVVKVETRVCSCRGLTLWIVQVVTPSARASPSVVISLY